MNTAFWLAFARPFLSAALYLLLVWWIARILWEVIPPGKIKSFLFKRRGFSRPR